MILAGAADNPVIFIVIILAFFGAIVGGVILAKKYLKPFKSEEVVKSDKEIAEEELNRILVDIEDEKPTPVDDEISHEDDTLARTLGEIDDPEAIKAMEEYAKQHQEEEQGENE